MIRITLDFETANTAGVDVTVVGAEVYAAHWATEILCLLYKMEGAVTGWGSWSPGDDEDALMAYARDTHNIWDAHGAQFEQAIWRHIMVGRFGFPGIPLERWDDTMAVCAVRSNALALEKVAKQLDLDNQKDMAGNKVTKAASRPDKRGYYDRSNDTLARISAYCRQDVAVEAELRDRIGNLSACERPIWELDQRINSRGVRLDIDFIRQCLSVVAAAKKPLLEEFRALTDGLAPGQVARLKEWLASRGVQLDSLRKEVIAALIGEEDDGEDSLGEVRLSEALPDRVRRVLTLRTLLGSSSITKLTRMLQCVGADLRSRGLLQYHGAHPGRWAGRLWQPQNQPRGTLKLPTGKFGPDGKEIWKPPSIEEVVATIMTGDLGWIESQFYAGDDYHAANGIEVVSHALRGAIIAEPGSCLFTGDFAGIEARIVLALAGQHDKAQLMAQGKDVYCDVANLIYRRNITKNDVAERTIGKNTVLGCGFGMGWATFQERYAKEHDETFCRQVIDTYRKQWAPAVPKLWYALEEAAFLAVQTPGTIHETYGVTYEVVDWWLECRMPSGQTMYYFDPRVDVTPEDDMYHHGVWSYETTKNGRSYRVDAYGGLLTENVVQAMARALMVEAMFRLESAGYPVVLTVHDEIVCERDMHDLWHMKDERLEHFTFVMSETPAWAQRIGIPIAVETWAETRYRKG